MFTKQKLEHDFCEYDGEERGGGEYDEIFDSEEVK